LSVEGRGKFSKIKKAVGIGQQAAVRKPGNQKKRREVFLCALCFVLQAIYLGDDLSLSDPRELLLRWGEELLLPWLLLLDF
jgi:hypothetical protein